MFCFPAPLSFETFEKPNAGVVFMSFVGEAADMSPCRPRSCPISLVGGPQSEIGRDEPQSVPSPERLFKTMD